jgi:lipoyl(octanoyl) transferase
MVANGYDRQSLDLTTFASPAGGGAVEWRVSDAPVPYLDAVAAMEARVAAIAAHEAPELVWLLEHPPLYTSGTSGKAGDLLDPRFPMFATGRGGQLTYHGPGQRVAYVMLDLKRPADVRALSRWSRGVDHPHPESLQRAGRAARGSGRCLGETA